MPGFITLTKCLLFNHIIRQLSARLRQAYLTPMCTGDHTELPPGCCFTRRLVSGCFWILPVKLSTWRLHQVHPFIANLAAVFHLFPSFRLAGLCGYGLFTHVDRNGASANRYRMKNSFWSLPRCTFLCEIPLLPEDEVQRSLLFLPIHRFFGLTPAEVCQTSFSQNKTSQNRKKKSA